MKSSDHNQLQSVVRRREILLSGILLLIGPVGCVAQQLQADTSSCDPPFVVKPYLQLGNAARLSRPERCVLMWHTEDLQDDFSVEVKLAKAESWSTVKSIDRQRVEVEGLKPHYVYRASISGLPCGVEFDYRVLKAGHRVFTARARSRKSTDQPYRFAALGDCGTNSPAQKAVAYSISKFQPDFVFIPGDIVYMWGRLSEYRENFFPVYNADDASAELGAPLLRSTLFFAGLGQHDTGYVFPSLDHADLDKFPDSLGYYLYWSLPLNGPTAQVGQPERFVLRGEPRRRQAFMSAAGDRFGQMAHYSFDYGNSHWTILETWNPAVDWNDPHLRRWLAEDLAAAKDATWKFVGCYLPPFSFNAKGKPVVQKMRIVADLFEQGQVDIVFCGFMHWYQRTFPLTFTARPRPVGEVKHYNTVIEGDFTIDRQFDGRSRTTPAGVIYITTGGGGAPAQYRDEQADPRTGRQFTAKFIEETYGFTAVEVTGKKLAVRQISKNGKVCDRFTITK